MQQQPVHQIGTLKIEPEPHLRATPYTVVTTAFVDSYSTLSYFLVILSITVAPAQQDVAVTFEIRRNSAIGKLSLKFSHLPIR